MISLDRKTIFGLHKLEHFRRFYPREPFDIPLKIHSKISRKSICMSCYRRSRSKLIATQLGVKGLSYFSWTICWFKTKIAGVKFSLPFQLKQTVSTVDQWSYIPIDSKYRSTFILNYLVGASYSRKVFTDETCRFVSVACWMVYWSTIF